MQWHVNKNSFWGGSMPEQQVDWPEVEIVGKVNFIVNGVVARNAVGEVRVLHVNSPVYKGDVILTGADGMITILFEDGAGARIDLGRASELTLDDEFLHSIFTGSGEDIEAIRQALLDGELDPTVDLAAPAAGGDDLGGEGGGGGHHLFHSQLTGQQLLASTPGAPTEGGAFFFADPVSMPVLGETTTVEPLAAPAVRALSAAGNDEILTFEGSAFGYSSFTSNFPILEMLLNSSLAAQVGTTDEGVSGSTMTLSDLLDQFFAGSGLDLQTFGVGTPGAQLIAEDLPNEDSITRIVTAGNLGTFSYDDEGLKFTPGENFSGEATVSFTIYYSNGESQQCSATITESYLKVGSVLNDQDGDDAFGLGYVVGEGSGAIEGGEAGDILVGDSFSIGGSLIGIPAVPLVALSTEGSGGSVSESRSLPIMSDDIYGGGGDDFLVGDSLDTRVLNQDVSDAITEHFEMGSGLDLIGDEVNLGWYAFTLLELFDDEWDRNDTISYLLDEDNQLLLNPETGHGESYLFGGDDFIDAGAGDDVVFGNAGDDDIYGDSGDDYLSGGMGSDAIAGGAGDDIIHAGRSSDVVAGGAGDDEIYGEQGSDLLAGGTGADYIDGGQGKDTMTGDNAVVNGSNEVILLEDDVEDIIIGSQGNDRLADGGGGGESVDASVEHPDISQDAFAHTDHIDELVPLLPDIV